MYSLELRHKWGNFIVNKTKTTFQVWNCELKYFTFYTAYFLFSQQEKVNFLPPDLVPTSLVSTKTNLLRRFICINNLWVLFILGVSLLQKLMKLLRSSINIKKKTSQNTCIIFGMHAFLCEYATQKNTFWVIITMRKCSQLH